MKLEKLNVGDRVKIELVIRGLGTKTIVGDISDINSTQRVVTVRSYWHVGSFEVSPSQIISKIVKKKRKKEFLGYMQVSDDIFTDGVSEARSTGAIYDKEYHVPKREKHTTFKIYGVKVK